jgi:glycerol-3-phosphate cytidylyltransferase
MIKGFVCSTFDLLHAGHLLWLKEAKSHCDYLVAALQTDPTKDRPYKNKPVESIEERIIRLQACRYIDEIKVYTTERELYALIEKIKPDIIVLGSDWKNKDNPIKGLAKIIYHNREIHGYSTTNLRARIVEAEKEVKDGR